MPACKDGNEPITNSFTVSTVMSSVAEPLGESIDSRILEIRKLWRDSKKFSVSRQRQNLFFEVTLLPRRRTQQEEREISLMILPMSFFLGVFSLRLEYMRIHSCAPRVLAT